MGTSRHRSNIVSAVSSDFLQQADYTLAEGNCDTGPVPPYNNWPTNTFSGHSQTEYIGTTMDDVVTPNFKVLQAQGKIVNNPLLKVHTELKCPLIDVDITYDVEKYGCTPARRYHWRIQRCRGTRSMDHLFGSGLFLEPDAIDLTHQQDLAITKAWSRVDHTEILSISALKELNSTVGGLAYILRKVYKISRAVRRKEIKQLKREISYKELEQVYMNARYNLRPLYYDIKAMIRILGSEVDKPGRQTYRGKSDISSTNSDMISVNSYGHGYYVNLITDLHRSVTTTGIVRSGVLTESARVAASQLWGLDTIVMSAWDLIPYSFIVDWFCNVGDTIAAWTPNAGIKPLASWVTVKKVVTQKSTIGNTNSTIVNGGGYYFENLGYNLSSESATKTVTTTERIPNYERPVLPTWNLQLDCGKLLDLGIILRNLSRYRRLAG